MRHRTGRLHSTEQLRRKLLVLLLLIACIPFVSSAQKKHVREVEVVKFDNYGSVDGEQKLMKQSYPDSIEPPAFDLAFAVKQFNFPPASDTLRKAMSGKPAGAFKPAQYDNHKRLVHYYRNAKESYEFEYNAYGNLQYIKRWGVKHVTAQMTFIYVY